MSDKQRGSFEEEQLGTVARCGSCGAIFRNVPWVQGMTCPRCKSADFKPVPIIHGALDYTLADRRGGFTGEDVRVGTLAKWVGLITPGQYNQALAMMRSRAVSEGESPAIGQVLIEQGWINETEHAALIQGAYHRQATQDDEEFARLAVQNGFVTRDQVEEIQKWQEEFQRKGRDVPAAALLFFEKRYLKENQVVALLRAQQLRGHGPLHSVWVASEASRRSGGLMEKLVGTTDRRSARIKLAVFIGVVILGVLVLRRVYFSGPSVEIDYMCKACGAIYPGRAVLKFPTKCKKCGKKAAYYCVQCSKCGTIYIRKDYWSQGEYCPKCHSGFYGRVKYDASGKPIQQKGSQSPSDLLPGK